MKEAVPAYMQDMDQAAAGHRFGLYFPIYSEIWELEKEKKGDALSKVWLKKDDQCRSKALYVRQQAQALQLEKNIFSLPAKSIAPFVTGMGYEHPVENGFAFLSPYGVPYLAGSSVKGVLRCAAQELGKDDATIAVLFGSDAEDGAQGALNFWDVFPEGKLAVEIMTPHHGKYLQGEETPHDSEIPIPIPFLCIAPDASFSFHVQLIREVDCDWQATLKECFAHAFEWLGFGAKTSVGYGEMCMDQAKQVKQLKELRLSKLSPLDQDIDQWKQLDPGHKGAAVHDWIQRMQQEEDKQAIKIAKMLRSYLESTDNWKVKKKGKKKERVQAIKMVLTRGNT